MAGRGRLFELLKKKEKEQEPPLPPPPSLAPTETTQKISESITQEPTQPPIRVNFQF